MNKSSVHNILKKDLRMSKLAPKFIPKILTEEQKRARKEWSEQNLQLLRDTDDLMDMVVTGDETWISVFEIERKEASREWLPKGTRADRPRKALRQRGERKAMLTVFFDIRGVVMSEFTPPGESITAESYLATLETLKTRIRRKRKDLWQVQDDGWHAFFLHHDNAPSHTAVPSLAFMGENQIRMLAHPPYSPDLAPCDFFLFPYLKNCFRGTRFANLDAMKGAVQRALREIPPEDVAQALRQSLPIRWMKCVKANGDYFEGSHLVVDPEGDHGLVVHQDSDEAETEDSSVEN